MKHKSMTSQLKQRLISSAVLIPSVCLVLWIGGAVLFAGLLCLCAMAIREWVRICRWEGRLQWHLIAFGVVYLSFSFLCLYDVSMHDPLIWLPLCIFIATWLSDSGAYLMGKTLQGPKMAVRISPNKTWSGFFGACLAPAIGLFVFQITYDHVFGFKHDLTQITFVILALEFGLVIGIAGQAGDLFVSWLKRRSAVKDTGTLIPGHGGLLDRIDALLLITIVFWMWMQFGGYQALFHLQEGWVPVWQTL